MSCPRSVGRALTDGFAPRHRSRIRRGCVDGGRRLALLFLAVLLGTGLEAQERRTAGIVTDTSGRPIPDARIEASGIELARTDATGRFSVKVPPGGLLKVRRLGFRATFVKLASGQIESAGVLRVVLMPAPEQLAGVFVPGTIGTPMSTSASRATIRQVPPLGEPDVFRVLPLLPGVSQPNDLLGRVHLAGAAGDETLLTLDGHPIQAPAHLTGVVGAMNVPSIERVEVRAHHVPATVMSRAGGTVALTTREFDERASGDASVTMLGASATATDPTLAGDLGILVSARRAYLREAVRLVSPGRSTNEPALTPSFLDALVRMTTPLAQGVRIEALGYHTSDHREPDGDGQNEPFRTREDLGALTVFVSGARWSSELRASWDVAASENRSVGAYGRALATVSAVRSFSGLVERRLGANSALALSAAEMLRTSSLEWNNSGFISSPGVPFRFDADDRQSLRSVGVEFRHDFTAPFTLSAGTQLSSVADTPGWYAGPRFHLGWRPVRGVEVDVAIDRRHQFDAEFSPPIVRSGGTPVFLLDHPRRMDGAALGFTWSGTIGTTAVALESRAYTRRYVDRPLGTPAVQDTLVHDHVQFSRSEARAAGIASGLTLRSARGLALQMAYTASSARQEAAGRWDRSDWDRPHVASVLLNVPVGSRWTVSASYRGQSGLPITPLDAVLLVPSPVNPGVLAPRLVLGEHNSARLGAFHRVDLMARRAWTRGRREWAFTAQLVNALASDNAIEYEWGLGGSTFVPRGPRTRPGLPLIPSIGVEVRW